MPEYICSQPLPVPLVNALQADDYDPGIGDYTPSSLNRPPYMAKLWSLYKDEVVIDLPSRAYMMGGKAIHKVLETASADELKYLRETRVYAYIGEKLVSMMFDTLCLENGELSDYKWTTVYKFIPSFNGDYSPAPDWEFQLNVGAYILRKGAFIVKDGHKKRIDSIDIKKLRIWGILRDHHKSGYVRDPKNYPQHAMAYRDFPIWTMEEAVERISERISLHEQAKNSDLDNIPVCTIEERWETPTKYAHMKKGWKKAVKLYNDKNICEKFVKFEGEGHFLEERPGERKRCKDYCDVSEFCPNYALNK